MTYYGLGKDFMVIEETSAFIENTGEEINLPEKAVITQLEDKDNNFRFIFNGKVCYQYYYTIEDKIEGARI